MLDSSTKASGSSTLPLPNQYDAKNIVTAKFDKRDPDQWHKGSPKVSIIPTSGFGDRRKLARGTDGGGHSFLLSYTPGTGANSAGQLELSMYGFDDYGGTAIFTLTADLEGGDTFNVNAFEIFTGHLTIHSSAMRPVLDNVDITATVESAND